MDWFGLSIRGFRQKRGNPQPSVVHLLLETNLIGFGRFKIWGALEGKVFI